MPTEEVPEDTTNIATLSLPIDHTGSLPSVPVNNDNNLVDPTITKTTNTASSDNSSCSSAEDQQQAAAAETIQQLSLAVQSGNVVDLEDSDLATFSPLPFVMSRGMSRGDSSIESSMEDYGNNSATGSLDQNQNNNDNSNASCNGNNGFSSPSRNTGNKIILQANHQHRLSQRKLKVDNNNNNNNNGNGGTNNNKRPNSKNGGKKHANSTNSSSTHSGADPDNYDNNGVPKVLLAPIAGAWGWIQKQQEKRKEQHLKQLAEEQIQRLKRAQKSDPSVNFTVVVSVEDSNSEYSMNSDSNTNNSNGGGGGGSASATTPQHTPDQSHAHEEDDEDDISWIPPVRCVKETRDSTAAPPSPRASVSGSATLGADPTKPVPFLLDAAQMHDIARYVLPKGIAFCRWKRLYSLTRDGDSFFQCLRLCGSEPKTLLVLKTTRGAVLGGYADSVWDVQSHQNGSFHGSAQACLFSFAIPPEEDENSEKDNKDNKNNQKPSKKKPTSTNLRVFHWSGANRYIQYTDKSEQRRMLAFGGGGQEGSFGLSVEQDFQLGSTGPCDTFDNVPLCDQENFNILDLEIWGFLTGQF